MTKETPIKIPIYTGWLSVVISDDFEYVCKKYNVDMDAAYSGAFVWTQENGRVTNFCIALKPNASNKYIAHECVHLCNNIFNIHDIKPDAHNDEPQAYLTGWLFEQVEKVLIKCRSANKKTA